MNVFVEYFQRMWTKSGGMKIEVMKLKIRNVVGAQLQELPRSASRSATPKKAGALGGARAPTIMPNKIKKWFLSRQKIVWQFM